MRNFVYFLVGLSLLFKATLVAPEGESPPVAGTYERGNKLPEKQEETSLNRDKPHDSGEKDTKVQVGDDQDPPSFKGESLPVAGTYERGNELSEKQEEKSLDRDKPHDGSYKDTKVQVGFDKLLSSSKDPNVPHSTTTPSGSKSTDPQNDSLKSNTTTTPYNTRLNTTAVPPPTTIMGKSEDGAPVNKNNGINRPIASVSVSSSTTRTSTNVSIITENTPTKIVTNITTSKPQIPTDNPVSFPGPAGEGLKQNISSTTTSTMKVISTTPNSTSAGSTKGTSTTTVAAPIPTDAKTPEVKQQTTTTAADGDGNGREDINDKERNENSPEEIDNDSENEGSDDSDKKTVKLPVEDEPSEGHFMAYFLTAVVLVVLGYILYHNKQKLMGMIVEGRNGGRNSRNTSKKRPNTKEYHQLQPGNVEEALGLDNEASNKNFIY